MASVSYIIRSEKKGSSEVPIWVLIRSTTLNLKTSTKIKVPFNLWDSKRQCLKPYRDKSTEIINRLDKLSIELSGLKDYLIDILSTKEDITKEELKSHIDSYLISKRKEVATRHNMNKFIHIVIEEMKNGTRLTETQNFYNKNSIKVYDTFLKVWTSFQNTYLKRVLDFENVDASIYTEFIKYCYSKDYTAETINKYLSVLRSILKKGVSAKLSTNTNFLDFKSTQENTDSKKPYLTDREIYALFNLELTDETQKKVRDIFLIGCYCGQRVSDYNNVTKDNLTTLKNGIKAFVFVQQKTKTTVSVPYLSDNVDTILNRWDYNLPRISDVTINKEIKKICRMANITELFFYKNIRGGKIVTSTIEKCDLITTHTARRSAITNLYKRNILNERELRSISGHKTEKSFSQYICLSSDEQAENIAEKLKADNESKKNEK